jgi:hypothetical protein
MMESHKLKALSDEYSLLMHTFSKKTIEALKSQPFFNILFPAVSRFLDENVEKEIKKDILTMKLVFNAYVLEKKVSEKEFDDIFQKTKEIDEEFLKKTKSLPLSINLSYKEIADIRKKRIKFLAGIVCDILNNWENHSELYETINLIYRQGGFKKIILELLHLYNIETRLIADSIKLPFFLQSAKSAITKNLYLTMERVAKELAEEWSNKGEKKKSDVRGQKSEPKEKFSSKSDF